MISQPINDITKIKRIVIVGWEMYPWYPSRLLKDALLDLGYHVIMKPVEYWGRFCKVTPDNLNYRTPIEYEPNENEDLVIVCQTDMTFKIISKAPVVYYHTDYTWYPSCVNAKYIITTFPEMEGKYRRYYPTLLKPVELFLWFKHFYLPSEYKDVEKKDGTLNFSIKKDNLIKYQGNITVSDRDMYEQRTIYNERAKWIGDLEYDRLIEYIPPRYMNDKQYTQLLPKWRYGIVVDGSGSYFSPRPIEYCAAGVVPIIYVGTDQKAFDYYNKAGFYHKDNCWFFTDRNDILEFIKQPQSVKDRIAQSGHDFVKKNYGHKKVFEDLFRNILAWEETLHGIGIA